MAHAQTQVHFASFDPDMAQAARSVMGRIREAHGRPVNVEINAELANLMKEILSVLADAGGIAFGPVGSVLSPEQAGKILGVSRPLVVQRMEDGRLPFHYVGSHRRCKLTDVLELKAQEDIQNKDLAAIYADLMEVDDAPAP